MVKFFKSRGIGMVDLLNLAILLVILVFYFISIPKNPYTYRPLLLLTATWISVWAAVAGRRTSFQTTWIERFRRLYLNFYPLIFLFVIFESFFMILPYFNPKDYDAALTNFDYHLLGVHPTVWIEHLFAPWVTDLMYLLYLFYFPFPFFILVYLYRKGMFNALDRSVFVLLFIYYGAYIAYFFVPAMGPRLYEPLMQLQTKSLDGLFFAIPIRHIISFFEPNKFDAFPSLHTAISLGTMILMAKYNRKMFYIFIPVVAGIWISLVYCRYHYVADIMAGIIWTIVAYYVANKIYDRMTKHGLFHFFESTK